MDKYIDRYGKVTYIDEEPGMQPVPIEEKDVLLFNEGLKELINCFGPKLKCLEDLELNK